MNNPNKTRKISINARFLTQPRTGVQRYAYELVRAWDKMLSQGEINPEVYQLTLLAPRLVNPVDQLACIPLRQVGRLSGNLWEQLDLALASRQALLFDPCNIGPVIKPAQAVTIHDVSVFTHPNSYTFTFRLKYRLVYQILAKTARIIITVSEFSKSEISRYLRISPGKIRCIYEGCDHINRVQPDLSVFDKHEIGQKPYILAVGSQAPHKNLLVLIQAAARLKDLDVDVVIAGGNYDHVFQATSQIQQESIKRLGYISDGELKALYQRATAFIFPSLYEGFGLPPLEAMACNCPVICAHSASLPEVCRQAVLYFDPANPQDLAEKITTLVGDPGLQEHLRKSGRDHSAKYTWKDSALKTWKALIE